MDKNIQQDKRARMKNGALREVRCACRSMRPTREQAQEAFAKEGMAIADYERVFVFMARVMTACGNIYQYDGSHGGGQTFTHLAVA
jgi:hypothetical protein